jgi:hypothetical protein
VRVADRRAPLRSIPRRRQICTRRRTRSQLPRADHPAAPQQCAAPQLRIQPAQAPGLSPATSATTTDTSHRQPYVVRADSEQRSSPLSRTTNDPARLTRPGYGRHFTPTVAAAQRGDSCCHIGTTNNERRRPELRRTASEGELPGLAQCRARRAPERCANCRGRRSTGCRAARLPVRAKGHRRGDDPRATQCPSGRAGRHLSLAAPAIADAPRRVHDGISMAASHRSRASPPSG